MDGWLSTSQNMVRSFVALALAVIVMTAPVFSGEYEGVDNIILTSRYGRTRCTAAKVTAGVFAAIFATALTVALNLILALLFYGTEGLDCSILFASIDYVEGFIPFNITCGALVSYQVLLAFTCTLSTVGATLLVSAMSKNQAVAFVVSMAVFLFPALVPITEASPLFRLVGLLPLYHVTGGCAPVGGADEEWTALCGVGGPGSAVLPGGRRGVLPPYICQTSDCVKSRTAAARLQ